MNKQNRPIIKMGPVVFNCCAQLAQEKFFDGSALYMRSRGAFLLPGYMSYLK